MPKEEPAPKATGYSAEIGSINDNRLIAIPGTPYVILDLEEREEYGFEMVRLARVVAPGIPCHLTQRGFDRKSLSVWQLKGDSAAAATGIAGAPGQQGFDKYGAPGFRLALTRDSTWCLGAFVVEL